MDIIIRKTNNIYIIFYKRTEPAFKRYLTRNPKGHRMTNGRPTAVVRRKNVLSRRAMVLSRFNRLDLFARSRSDKKTDHVARARERGAKKTSTGLFVRKYAQSLRNFQRGAKITENRQQRQ